MSANNKLGASGFYHLRIVRLDDPDFGMFCCDLRMKIRTCAESSNKEDGLLIILNNFW